MPNRIIKESIRDSKTISSLSDFEFRLWVCLITFVDDYGRGTADPELIKGHVFPRRPKVSCKEIRDALTNLANKGCIVIYEVDHDLYFYFPKWANHQRIQTKKSKYPDPDSGIVVSPLSTVNHGDSPPESNPIQSNTNPNPNTNMYDSEFEEAWKLYPRKEGSKADAKRDYINARKEGISKETILNGVLKASEYYKTIDNPKYIPMGSTWFHQRRWENDYTPTRKGSYFQPTAQYMDYKTYEANAVEVDDDIEDFNFGGNTNVNGH